MAADGTFPRGGGFLLVVARPVMRPLKMILGGPSLRPWVMLSILDNDGEWAYALAARKETGGHLDGDEEKRRNKEQSHVKEEKRQPRGRGSRSARCRSACVNSALCAE